MIFRFLKSTFLFVLISIGSCGNDTPGQKQMSSNGADFSMQNGQQGAIISGANRMEEYLPLLMNKKVGIVGNQTSIVHTGKTEEDFVHLVDTLISRGVRVSKVYAPEHGFRGTADAGEVIKDGRDIRTGLPVLSLYGNNKKPSSEQLRDVDVMIFDIQDVGARFYTYISTLHYVMEACAENNIPVIVLDRPNPNGHYIDGPILEPQHQSFVGMHPIPVVHGLTIGEYAQMINGEQWLKNNVQADLNVIKMEDYDHQMEYDLPVKPSPNLPNSTAINLYPSLCFFEGTNVNAGRGTSNQFQVFGSPYLDKEHFDYTYVPRSNEGAKNPKHLGETCYGRDLTGHERMDRINLEWLIEAYNHTANKREFFNNFFTNLAGTKKLQEQIEAGMSAEKIRETWEQGLKDFSVIRKNYLLYDL